MTKATHLNIKSGEAHKLATELAGLTGESLTSADTGRSPDQILGYDKHGLPT